MSNDVHQTASAIAAFDATQLAFAALVKKGILPKAEAEQILRQAMEVIKTGGAGGSSRRIARHRFGEAFQGSAGTSAIKRPRKIGVMVITLSSATRRRATEQRDELATLHLCAHSITSGSQGRLLAVAPTL